MRKWFIEITCKTDDFKITIYSDGAVYGIERGKQLGTLTTNAMDELNFIINENLGEFRKLGYHNYNHNPLVLKINDTNKNKIHKIVGWPQISNIMIILRNKSNFKEGLIYEFKSGLLLITNRFQKQKRIITLFINNYNIS